MDTLYVILNNISVKNANAEQNAYVVGAPSPLSLLSYADAYAFAAKTAGIDITTRWVLPIYHRLSESCLHQGMLKREVSGINETESDVLSPPTRDELRIDFELTLVMAFNVDPFDESIEGHFLRLRSLLPSRIAGGRFFLNRHNNKLLVLTRSSDWKSQIPLGNLRDSNVLRHRPDVTEMARDAKTLLELTSDQRGSRLSPIAIGYQKISTQKKRAGQRDPEAIHVFVDPLLSVAEWRYASTIYECAHVWVKKETPDLLISDSIQEHHA